MLAAGNVYTSLKVAIIDGGSITAALLGIGIFAAFWRSRTPYSALENNITQTTASSAAVMSFVTGVVGPIPALALMGTRFSTTALVVFGAAVGILGVFVAALLRRRLVVEEAPPVPDRNGDRRGDRDDVRRAPGRPAATRAAADRRRLRRRDHLVPRRPAGADPAGVHVRGNDRGRQRGGLGLGFSCSPLMLATGAMVGLRAAAGLLLGAIIARVALAPWLVNSGIAASAELGALNQWLVWPALGLLLAGSFLPLLLDGGAIVRSLPAARVPRTSRAARPAGKRATPPPRPASGRPCSSQAWPPSC